MMPTIKEQALQNIEARKQNKAFDATKSKADTNLRVMSERSPDAEATTRNLATQFNVTPALARDAETDLKRDALSRVAQAKFNKTQGLQKYLSNPDNAAISHDDMNELARVEESASISGRISREFTNIAGQLKLRQLEAGTVGQVGLDIPGILTDVGASVGKTALRFGPTMAKVVDQLIGFTGGTLESLGEKGEALFGEQDIASSALVHFGGWMKRYGLESAEDIQGYLDDYLNLPEEKQGPLIENLSLLTDPEWLTFNVGEAANSMLPMIAAATYTGGAAAPTFIGGAMEGADLYDSLSSQGVEHDKAATASLAYGTVTGILNKFGLDSIMRRMPAGNAAQQMFHRFVSGSVEAGTEYLEEPFQAAFESIARGDSLGETENNVLQSLKNIDVIPGAFLLGAGSAGTLTARGEFIQDQSEAFVETMDNLSVSLEETKTKARSPEAMEEFLTANPEIAKTAFISSEGALRLFQESPETASIIMAKSGLNPKEAQAKAEQGEDIQIDLPKALSYLQSEELAQIKDDLKPAPAAWSKRELDAKAGEQEIERVQALGKQDIEDDIEIRREVDRIGQEIKALNRANISAEQVDAYTDLLARVANRQGLGADFVRRMSIRGIKWGAVTPTPPVETEFTQGQQELLQSAFHGTPHKFDKFTLDAIGTGEGAQAFGWGLYFTSSKEIAEFYREGLTGPAEIQVDGEAVPKNIRKYARFVLGGADPQTRIGQHKKAVAVGKARLETYSETDPRRAQTERHILTAEKAIEGFEFLKGKEIKEVKENTGQLFEVEIPEDDVMLDWDKPLSEQPEKVQEALPYDTQAKQQAVRDKLVQKFKAKGKKFPHSETTPPVTGAGIYERLAEEKGSDQAASEYLNSLGIKGIKYEAGQISGTGEGDTNFVIFDDQTIEPLKTFYQAQQFEQAAVRTPIAEFTQGQQYNQEGQIVTDTPAFKNWFGESKVVDEAGEPLVVYHGTMEQIDEFKTGLATSNFGMLGNEVDTERHGVFFSKDLKFAEEFGEVGEYYIKADNVFDFEAGYARPLWEEFNQSIRDSGNAELISEIEDSSFEIWGYFDDEIGKRFVEFIRGKGYDAASFIEDVDDIEAETVVVFEPTQIKSTSNRGTFDPEDPRILFQSSVRTPAIDPEALSKKEWTAIAKDLKQRGFDIKNGPDAQQLYEGRSRDLFQTNEDWYEAALSATGQVRQEAAPEVEAPTGNIEFDRIAELGLTDNPNEAGYITPDGGMVDLSGKNEGGPSGSRNYDHREAGGTEGMSEFMNLGNIRFFPENQGFDIYQVPTSAQYQFIREIAEDNNGEIQVEVGEGIGKWDAHNEQYGESKRRDYKEYDAGTSADEIIEDIRAFYKGAPQYVSPFRQFRQAQQFEQARGSITFRENQQTIIEILTHGDVSTLIHETAHMYLEEISAIVENGAADEQLTADFETTRKWLESEPGTEFTVAQHEKFARGFEAYLLDGKAPTAALSRAFARFSRWLKEIYQNARALNVKISEPMKQVFDRMLTSEQEINTAATDLNLKPLPDDQLKALGVLPEDIRYIKALSKQAQAQAEAAMVRDRNRGLKEKRARWRAEAVKEVNEDPVFQMIDSMKETGTGFDREQFLLAFGEDRASRLPTQRMLKTDGMRLEEAALLFGFEGVGQMIEEVSQRKPRAMEVKDRVAEKQKAHDAQYRAEDYIVTTSAYADYLAVINRYYAGEIVRAREAVGDTTVSVEPEGTVVTERAKAPSVITRQAYNKVAKDTLDVLSVSEATQHYKFMNAMKTATLKEQKAAAAGNLGLASQQNELARLNFAKAGYAVKNRQEVQVIERRLKRTVRALVKNTDKLTGSYRDQIIAAVNRFGLTNRVPLDPANMGSLADILAGQIPDGKSSARDPFAASDAMLNLNPRSYKKLAMEEFRELDNMVKYLSKWGVPEQERLLRDGRKVSEVSEEMTAETLTIKSTKRNARRGTKIRAFADKARTGWALFDSLPFIMASTGGYQNLGRQAKISKNEQEVSEALGAASAEENRIMRGVQAQLDPHMVTLIKWKKAMVKKFGASMDLGVETPQALRDDGQVDWWSPAQIINLALYRGSESNLARVFSGFESSNPAAPAFTMDEYLKLVDHLGKAEWDAIQAIWDINEELNKLRKETFQKINGYPAQSVEAAPFETKFGKYRGGYSPIKYDTRLADLDPDTDRIASIHEKDDLMAKQEAVHQVPFTKSGFNKKRAIATPYPVALDSLQYIISGMGNVAHYATHAEVVADVDALIRNKAYKKAVVSKLGIEVYNQIRPAVAHAANNGSMSTPDPQVNKAAAILRGMATARILGLNAKTSVKQVFSSFSAVNKLGARDYAVSYLKALTKFASNPPKYYKERVKFMQDSSKYMEQRSKSFDREMQVMFKGMSPDQKVALFGDKAVTWDDVANLAFYPIQMADACTVVPLWNGAYETYLRDHKGEPDAHEKAVKEADNLIRLTQPSSQNIDRTAWQRNHPMLAMFGTYTIGKYQQRVRLNYRALKAGAIKPGEYTRHIAYDIAIPGFMMNLLFAVIYGADWDDEETWNKLAIDSAAQMAVPMIPVAGSLLNPYGYDGALVPPALESLEDVVGNFKKAWITTTTDGYVEGVKDTLWAVADLISYYKRVPVTRLVETTQRGIEQAEESGRPIEVIFPEPGR